MKNIEEDFSLKRKSIASYVTELNTMEPRNGLLLVSEPSLDEPHFNHSIVMLIDYGRNEDSLGIVINRSTPFTLDKAIDGVNPNIHIPIFAGGPVGLDRLIYLHTLGPAFHDTKEISPGLFLGGDLNEVLDYVNSGYETEGIIRFFIGYSGWSAGQLDGEINNGSWAVANPIQPRQLLSLSDNSLWHEVVRSMGNEFKDWRYSPQYPNLN